MARARPSPMPSPTWRTRCSRSMRAVIWPSSDPTRVKNFPADIQVGNFVRTKLGYAALVSNTEQMKGLPVPDDWTSFADAAQGLGGPRRLRGSARVVGCLHGAGRAQPELRRGEDPADLQGPQEHAPGSVHEHAGQRGQARLRRAAADDVHPHQPSGRRLAQGRAARVQDPRLGRRPVLFLCRRAEERRAIPTRPGSTSSTC